MEFTGSVFTVYLGGTLSKGCVEQGLAVALERRAFRLMVEQPKTS